jgi:hypothetical protein
MQDFFDRFGRFGGNERTLIELCIEIAKGDIGGDRFNQLLLEAGVSLDDAEWEVANRILGRSDQLQTMATDYAVCVQ